MARRKPKIATQAVGSIPARDGDDLTEQTNFDEVKDFAKSFFKNGIMPLASHEVQAQKDKAAKIIDDKRLLRNLRARKYRRAKLLKQKLANEAEMAALDPDEPKPKAEPKKHQPRFKVRSQSQRKARRGRKS
tara:strand:+ start:1093 stop:1488 length:396 start_codon:yes stop_codon:yes gene_type:complete